MIHNLFWTFLEYIEEHYWNILCAFVQKTYCRRPIAEDLLQKTYCRRSIAEDLSQKTYCRRPIAEDLFYVSLKYWTVRHHFLGEQPLVLIIFRHFSVVYEQDLDMSHLHFSIFRHSKLDMAGLATSKYDLSISVF